MNRLVRLPRFFRLSWLVFALAAAACGQKGPPRAPIVFLPRPVTEVTAKRIENDVVLQFTVPTLNTDSTSPADLRRIEVYAHTGPLPAPADFVKYGALVASIPIKKPKTEEERKAEERPEGKEQETGATGASGARGATGAIGASGAIGAIGAQGAEGATDAAPDVAGTTAGPVMVEQGWKTTVRETLTPKHLEIGPMPPTRLPPPPPDDAPVVVVEKVETPGTVNFDLPPQRYYAIFGVSESRGRRGPHAGPIQVALLNPLSPPDNVEFAYTENAISLTWPAQPEDTPMTTPVGLSAEALGGDAAASSSAPPSQTATADKPTAPAEVLPPVDRETEGTVALYADVETEDTKDVLVATVAATAGGAQPNPVPALVPQPPAKPRFGYNVYDAGAVDAKDATAATRAMPAPNAPNAPSAPLNASLLTSPGFSDPRVEFGVERCYVVRRVEMAGTVAVESAPSNPLCVTPVDTFPPAAPKSLAHIASGNGVSLLWEANTEPDLGGYLVLRAEAPDDTLSPLMTEPTTDTSFLDTTVRSGRTYVYEVIAVDRSTPPNRSAPSNRVEETIR